MLCLTRVWTSFSTTAGGGAPGKAAGIAHGTTTQVGPTMEEPRIFIDRYRQAGGITTGIVAGTDINGIISGYLSDRFNRTGEAGKRTGTGNGIIPGEWSAGNIGRNVHSHNVRWRHNSITLVMKDLMVMEDLIEVTETAAIEDRMIESPYLPEMAASNNVRKSYGQ